MRTDKAKRFFNGIKRSVGKHSPEIMIGMGMAGMVATTVMAVKATPKALVLIDQAENEKNDELTKTEVLKAAWKPYIPAAVTCVLSVGCIIGGTSANMRRMTAMATA